jgi:hypothetical protein
MSPSGHHRLLYGLHGIWLEWHTTGVDIYWPEAFGVWLDRLEADARSGDQRARTILAYAARALDHWFPPRTGTVVVALFAADKARLGDVFSNGVAARADPLIDQWKRETAYEEES